MVTISMASKICRGTLIESGLDSGIVDGDYAQGLGCYPAGEEHSKPPTQAGDGKHANGPQDMPEEVTHRSTDSFLGGDSNILGRYRDVRCWSEAEWSVSQPATRSPSAERT
jgi:hypothetical protein